MNRKRARQHDKSARHLSLTSFIFFTTVSRKVSCGLLALFMYSFHYILREQCEKIKSFREDFSIPDMSELRR